MVSSLDARPHFFSTPSRPSSSQAITTTKMSSAKMSHNSSLALQKYMLLQEQHEELCNHLDQIRPQLATSSSSLYSSPSTSPTRSSNSSLSSSPRRHSRSGRHHSRSHPRHCGWEESQGMSTIIDEETIYEISAEEQRLFDINESIKRALTELLNCSSVRSDRSFRTWVQSRLMETEKELRSGRRKRSSASME